MDVIAESVTSKIVASIFESVGRKDLSPRTIDHDSQCFCIETEQSRGRC